MNSSEDQQLLGVSGTSVHSGARFASRLGLATARILMVTSAAILLLASSSTALLAQVNVYTRSYDTSRTGANLNETILTPANVTAATFGKLFTVPTDGQLYAQPLYVSNLAIAGGTHNVVFVASMRNTVYAIDADSGAILWTQNFGTPITPQEVENDQNITWDTGIGILGTPVIDPETNYMYFASGFEEQVNGSPVYSYHLNAIDITDGQPVHGSPVTISATYSTADLVSPKVFNAKMQNQRPALALANGNVYIAFSSHEDQKPYSGWVLGYSKSTLAQIGVYSDTTIGIQGGIWNAGGAPTIDAAGNLYLSTGNGSFGVTPNNLVQTGNSFIKLSPTLQLLDYFTPTNSATLNSGDQDLGSSGLLLIPNTNYLLGGGKQGVLYLDDTTAMGGFNSSTDQVRQEFQAIFGNGTSHIHGAPIYFNSAVNGPSTFVWGENDTLRGFLFNPTTGLLDSKPFAVSTMTAPVRNNTGAMPGGFLAVSANGASNGIVWASTPYLGDAVHKSTQGVLYAFNADTMKELWSDKFQDTRDEIGFFAKYVPPVVANGKMYMSSFGPLSTTDGSGALVVYGLLPTGISFSPSSFTFADTRLGTTSAYQPITVTNTGTATISFSSFTAGGADASSFGIPQGYQGCTPLAAGATCTFDIAFTPTTTGPLTGSILIADNAGGSPQSIAVSGNGLVAAVPIVSISPASFTFANTRVGTTSAYQPITVTNKGNATLKFTSLTPVGTNASSFSIPSGHQGCSPLAPGASCIFDIAFTPTTAGALSASIQITDNATDSPQSVAMSGTGLGTAAASVSPTSFTFANTRVGTTSAYQPITVTNTGNGTLTFTSITPVGTNASSFSIPSGHQGCSPLAAGASCSFDIAFTPTAAGTFSASIQIADNATGSPQLVAVSGTGLGGSAASVSPTSFTFANTRVGTTSSYQPITVTNTGSATLNFSSITPVGANASLFSVPHGHQGCSPLAPGASCSFDIAFTPTAPGTFSASIQITDNATGSPQLVAVTGTGLGSSAASVSPTSFTFASTRVGTTSAYQPITVTNTGNATLNFTSITPVGANAAMFSIPHGHQGCSPLAPGANCTFDIAFTPTATGTFTASIQIVDNASGSPQLVAVSGTGK